MDNAKRFPSIESAIVASAVLFFAFGAAAEWSPFGIGLFGVENTQYPAPDESVYGLNIGIFGSHFDKICGLSVASFATVSKDVSGFEVSGICNWADHSDEGFLQVAGLFNYMAGNCEGMQISGICNDTRGNFSGLQVACLNIAAKNLMGLQVGAVNVASVDFPSGEYCCGAQIGAVNYVDQKVFGAQIGVVNVADSLQGVQIGLINKVMRKMNGVQIGLVNMHGNGHAIPIIHATFE